MLSYVNFDIGRSLHVWPFNQSVQQQGGRVTRERILVLFFFCIDVAIFAVRSRISGLLAQLTQWSILFIREQVRIPVLPWFFICIIVSYLVALMLDWKPLFKPCSSRFSFPFVSERWKKFPQICFFFYLQSTHYPWVFYFAVEVVIQTADLWCQRRQLYSTFLDFEPGSQYS